MIRVLKDRMFNLAPYAFFCCTKHLHENHDDVFVIQHTTSNTSYFSDDCLEGLKMDSVAFRDNPWQCCGDRRTDENYYDKYTNFYGFEPVEIKAMRLDWLLDSETD